jgi:large subunit ribosomal protein L23
MPELYRAIIKPLVTEKSSALYENRKIYTFRVDASASKPEIRDTIEHLFGVTVQGVRTMQMRAKERRAGGLGRGTTGRRTKWKKAIVTLKEGDVIPIFEG